MRVKHIVSVSGGLSSSIVLDLVVKKYGQENTVAVFCDTKTEDIDLYRFNDDIKNLYPGIEWVTLCDGRTIWQLFEDKKFHGNNRIAPCSKYLKQEIFRKYLKSHSPEECIVYLGIGFEEMHRCDAITANSVPYVVIYPLIDWVKLMPKDKLEYFPNITPPRLYAMGFPHNNCGGLCVKTGQAQMRLLHDKLPETYAAHEAEQERIMNNNHNLCPFIRVTRNKVTRRLSLKEFRIQYIEPKTQIDENDWGGCGCFSDG